MSNEKHKIDELFRQKLASYEVAAPDHVWRNIEAKRTPLHKAINYFKNKRAAVGITAMLVITSLAYVGFVNMGQDNSQAVSTEQTVIADTKAPFISPAEVVNSTGSTGAESTNTADSHTTGNNGNGSTVSGGGNQATVALNTANAHSANKNNSSAGNNPPASGNGNNQPVQNPDNNNTNTIDKPVQENIITTPVTETVKPVELPAEEPVAAAQETENPVADAGTPPATEKTDEANKQEKTLIKPERLRKWAVDVYGGVNMAGRSLSANGASQQYINERNYSESFRPGLTLGARAVYDLNKAGCMKIRGGFMLTQINERVNFSSTVTTNVVNPVTVIKYDMFGRPIGTDIRYDTVQKTTTNTASANNRYTFIDLPIQLEANCRLNRHWSVFGAAGAALNLRFTQSGAMLSRDFNGVKEFNNSASPFKTNAGVSLLMGAGAEYSVCGNFSLLMEAQYRQGLNSVFNSNEGMNQTFRTFSLGAGLRYRF